MSALERIVVVGASLAGLRAVETLRGNGFAGELGVPEAIIDKAPSAGLWLGQTDEAEMGFTYAELERYLTEGPDTVAPALALRIERLMCASEHKRAAPMLPPEEP